MAENNNLFECIKNNNIHAIKKLLFEGISSEILNTALIDVSEIGNCEIVKLLLENGADVHGANDSALRLSAENGHDIVVKLLLENGADVSSIHCAHFASLSS